jgi:hypothetical protein
MTFQIESLFGVEKACDREKRLDPKEKRDKEKKTPGNYIKKSHRTA